MPENLRGPKRELFRARENKKRTWESESKRTIVSKKRNVYLKWSTSKWQNSQFLQKRKMLKKFLWQCFRCFQSTYHRDQRPADGGFVIHHYLSLLVTTCHYLSSITTFRTWTEFTTLFLLGLIIDIKIGKTMTTINWLGSDWNDPWKVLGLQPWSLHNDVDTLYPIFQQELRQNIIVVMLGKDNFTGRKMVMAL